MLQNILFMCMFNSVIGKSKLIFRVIDFTLSNMLLFLWLKQKDIWKKQKNQYFSINYVT